MNPLWRDVLTSLVRRILTLVAGILVARGFIDADMNNRLITEGSVEIAAAIILFAGVSWASHRSKVKSWFETMTALNSPEGTSLQEVLDKSHGTTVSEKKKTVEKEMSQEVLDAKP